MNYELHPLCTLFPSLAGNEFDALCADIKTNGLREPIVLHDGQILDGGNRYRACLAAGVAPVFTPFEGESIVSFVLSANLHRRHMTPGQQAAIVASAQDWARAQSIGRPKSGNVAAFSEHVQTGTIAPLQTVQDRAAESGASERTQRMADKVAKADPELVRKVAHGEVTLPQAIRKVEGKPAKPQKAKPAPARDMIYEGEDLSDAMNTSVDELLSDLKDLQKENDALTERIKALTCDDVAKELDNQIRIRQGIEARLGQEMNRANQYHNELRGYGKFAADLRKVLGIEGSKSQLLAAVRELVNNQRAAF